MNRKRKTKKHDGSPDQTSSPSSGGRTRIKPPPSPATRVLTSRALLKGKFPSPKRKQVSPAKSGRGYSENSTNASMDITFGLSDSSLDLMTFTKNLARPGWHKNLDSSMQTIPLADLTGDEPNDSNLGVTLDPPPKRMSRSRKRISVGAFQRAAAEKSSNSRESDVEEADNGRGDSSSVNSESSDKTFDDADRSSPIIIPQKKRKQPKKSISGKFAENMAQHRSPAESPETQLKNFNSPKKSDSNNQSEYIDSPIIVEVSQKSKRAKKRISGSVFQSAVADMKFSESPKSNKAVASPVDDDSESDTESSIDQIETTYERKKRETKGASLLSFIKDLDSSSQSKSPVKAKTPSSLVSEDTSESESQADSFDIEAPQEKQRYARKLSVGAFARAMGPVRESDSPIPRPKKSLSAIQEKNDSDLDSPIVVEQKKRRIAKKVSMSAFELGMTSFSSSDSSISKRSKSFATIPEDNESDEETPINSPVKSRRGSKNVTADSFTQAMEQDSSRSTSSKRGQSVANISEDEEPSSKSPSKSPSTTFTKASRLSKSSPKNKKDSSSDISEDVTPESPINKSPFRKRSFVGRDSLSAFKNITGKVRHSNIVTLNVMEASISEDSGSDDGEVGSLNSSNGTLQNKNRITKDSSKAFMSAMGPIDESLDSSVSISENIEAGNQKPADATFQKSNRDSLSAFKNIKNPVRHSHIPPKNVEDIVASTSEDSDVVPDNSADVFVEIGNRDSLSAFKNIKNPVRHSHILPKNKDSNASISIPEDIEAEPQTESLTKSVPHSKIIGERESLSGFARLGPVRHSNSPIPTETASTTGEPEQNTSFEKSGRQTFTKEISSSNKSSISQPLSTNKNSSVSTQVEGVEKRADVTITLSSPRKSAQDPTQDSDMEVEGDTENFENLQTTKKTLSSQNSTADMSISSLVSSPTKNKTLDKEIENKNVTPKKSPQVVVSPRQSPRLKGQNSRENEISPRRSDRIQGSPSKQSSPLKGQRGGETSPRPSGSGTTGSPSKQSSPLKGQRGGETSPRPSGSGTTGSPSKQSSPLKGQRGGEISPRPSGSGTAGSPKKQSSPLKGQRGGETSPRPSGSGTAGSPKKQSSPLKGQRGGETSPRPSGSGTAGSPSKQSPRLNMTYDFGKNNLTKESIKTYLNSSIESHKESESESEDNLSNIVPSVKVLRSKLAVSMSVFADAVADLESTETSPAKRDSTTSQPEAASSSANKSLTKDPSSAKNLFSAADLQLALELLEARAAEEELEDVLEIDDSGINVVEPDKGKREYKYSIFDFNKAMESLDASLVTSQNTSSVPEPRLTRSSRLSLSTASKTSFKQSPRLSRGTSGPHDSVRTSLRSNTRRSGKLSTSVTNLSLSKKQGKMESPSQRFNATSQITPNTTNAKLRQKSFLQKRYTLMDLQRTMEAVRSPSITSDTSIQSLRRHSFTAGKYSLRDIERAVTTLRAENTYYDDDDTTKNISAFSLPKPRTDSATRSLKTLELSEIQKDQQDSTHPAILSIHCQSETADASSKKLSFSTSLQVPNITLENQSLLPGSSRHASTINTSVLSEEDDVSAEILLEEPSRKSKPKKKVSFTDFQKAMEEFPSPTASEKSKNADSSLNSSTKSKLDFTSSQSKVSPKVSLVVEDVRSPSKVGPFTTPEVEMIPETSEDSPDSSDSSLLDWEILPLMPTTSISPSANNSKKIIESPGVNIKDKEAESEKGHEQEMLNNSFQDVPNVDGPEENIDLIDISGDDEERHTPSPNESASQVQVPESETLDDSSANVSDEEDTQASTNQTEEPQDDDPSDSSDSDKQDSPQPSSSEEEEEEEEAEETAPQNSSSAEEDEMETNENGNISDTSTILGTDDLKASISNKKSSSFKENTAANFSGVLATSTESVQSASGSKQQQNSARRDLTSAFTEITKSPQNKTRSEIIVDVVNRDPTDKSAVINAIKDFSNLVAACKPSIADKISKQYAKKNAAFNTIEKKVKKTAVINPERLFHGKVYRKPRLVRPKPWVTTKFYNLLEDNFAKKKPYEAKKLSEEFVQKLEPLVTEVTKTKSTKKLRESVIRTAKLLHKEGFVTDDYSFFNFSSTYLPNAFVSKTFPYNNGEPHNYLD